MLTQYFGKICQILGTFSFTTNCVYFCFFTENIFHTFPPKLTFSKNNEPNVKFHVKCCRNTVFYGIICGKILLLRKYLEKPLKTENFKIYHIPHTPGADNVVADALSRPPAVLLSSCTPATAGLPVLSIPPPSDPPLTPPPAVAADAQPIDFTELAFAQPSCPDVQAMLVSPSLSVVSKKVGPAEILGDVSTGVFRPLLPARFRTAAVWSLHNIHHPGVRASRRLVCADC